MKKVYMWCYNPYSEGGALLAQKLDILRIKHEGSTFYGNASHTVINWGASLKKWGPSGHDFKILNRPDFIGYASNKLSFFDLMSTQTGAARIPDWTTSNTVAREWLTDGYCVIGRKLLEGMGGEGIIVMEKPVDFTPCKLYTKYIDKTLEYRVYVVGGKVVDYCQKKRKLSETPANWKIRSRENGFVFCWPETPLPEECATQSILAVKACGLDFGGVDVVLGSKDGKAYVLEVNTAPWLSEYTADLMAKAIKEELLAA